MMQQIGPLSHTFSISVEMLLHLFQLENQKIISQLASKYVAPHPPHSLNFSPPVIKFMLLYRLLGKDFQIL